MTTDRSWGSMGARPRVGIIINSFAGGGAERSAILVAGAWPNPQDVLLIACRDEGPLRSTVRDGALTAHLDAWPSLRSLVRFMLRLRRLVRQRKLDVLISNGYGLNQVVLLTRVLRLIRCRVVTVEQGTMSEAFIERFPSHVLRRSALWLTRALYLRSDAIVGVSHGVSQDLEETLGFPSPTATTIHNPVDVAHVEFMAGECPDVEHCEHFCALPRPIIVAAGRLVPPKGHADLIAACATAGLRHRGSLIILGEGPTRVALEELSERLGVSRRVWMPGFVDNPWWFISHADLFCLPSHHEGHPLALLEALACNVPIVAADCPSGPREILGDTPGTRLTPVADPSRLAETISELLDDPVRPDIDLSELSPTSIASRYAALVVRLPFEGHR